MARSADPAVRVALIEAAARLLVTDGLDALSIRRVAGEVGASTMAVYTHFGSKQDLVREVVAEGFSRLEVATRAVPVTEDPLGDLAAVGRAYRTNALADAPLYRVMFGLNPLALDDPSRAEHEGGHEIGLGAFQVVTDAVARCVDAGLLAGDPRQLALQVWAMAHGTVSLELAGFLDDHGEATFEAMTRTLALGLGN